MPTLAEITRCKAMKTPNLTQFCIANGFTTPGNVLDHGTLSPSGKTSRRSQKAADQRYLDRLESAKAGERAYQTAIDDGEITDPTGKFTPTPFNNLPDVAALRKEREALMTTEEFLIKFGTSAKTGKVRPSYLKKIATCRCMASRINQLIDMKRTIRKLTGGSSPEIS